MKLVSIFILSLLMSTSLQSIAAEDLPYTSEAPVTAYHLAKDLTGFVKSKNCEKCKERRYKITPEIKATLDNKEVPLSRFVLSKQKPNYLVFSSKTNELVGMTWFSKK